MTFDRHTLNTLYQYCFSLCGKEEDAYDLLHDALEKFLQSRRKNLENPQAFVKKIARNRFFDLQRRKKIVHFDVLEESDDAENTSADLESLLVDKLTLQKVWNELTANEREVLYLWAVEGMSTSEIALELDTPRATILSRLRRLRIRIENSNNDVIRGSSYE